MLERAPQLCVRWQEIVTRDVTVYAVPKYVERFRKRWPEVGIEIRTGTGKQRLA